MIRIEHYIEYYKDKRLITHGPGDVEKYLEKQGQSPKIQDWQFRQVIDAIQNLFAMLNVAWLNDVDWQHWMTSVSLSTYHPSIARDTPAEETVARLAKNIRSDLADVRR